MVLKNGKAGRPRRRTRRVLAEPVNDQVSKEGLPRITGGIDIAMKVPPHQYQATIGFYRDVIGLKTVTDKAPAIAFELGPNRLWIDESPGMSQAEIWLELFSEDFEAAAAHLERAGVTRCDAIEPLPQGFRGGWIMNPANVVHMVREPDAW